jgi:Predicted AAA-ATPase
LKFDFSIIPSDQDPVVAKRNLIMGLNYSFEKFYETYATYLGEDVTSLYGNINSENPAESLRKCIRSVQRALSLPQEENNEELNDVQGIYLLVDEYDAFSIKYLEPPNTVKPYKTTLDGTSVGEIFRSFWCMIKLLCTEGIQRVFITGISPLSLTDISSTFNIPSNLSSHQKLAGLCGLTISDLEAVLKKIREDNKNDEDDKNDKDDKNNELDKHLSEMTKSFNGYHFCSYKRVETVYNTETCLAYLQSIIDGGDLETEDPPNSEVPEHFLQKFLTSPFMITDLKKALRCDENGDFVPLKYGELYDEFSLQELVC